MKIAHPKARVLVTGGAGFIGSHLVDLLVGSGVHVIVLDNFRNGKHEYLEAASKTGRLRVIEGDITDGAACAGAMEQKLDALFHLACLGVRHSLHDPAENHLVNATGTLQLLMAARRAEVGRFVYMSTSEVYGAALTFPLTEQAATWPTTVYGASKLAGEHYAAAFHRCHGLPVVRVRPFNNYGPRAHFEGDSGEVIPRFILRALGGEPPVIFGDGSHTRDFLYVKDCAEALVDIAECDALVGDIVNLGYGEEVRIDEIARMVAEAAGRKDLKPQFSGERPGDVARLWVDPSKLRAATSFRPRTRPAEGLAATVEYYRALYKADPGCLSQMQTRNWEVA
jgi:UDP-glucose 4-epimerase